LSKFLHSIHIFRSFISFANFCLCFKPFNKIMAVAGGTGFPQNGSLESLELLSNELNLLKDPKNNPTRERLLTASRNFFDCMQNTFAAQDEIRAQILIRGIVISFVDVIESMDKEELNKLSDTEVDEAFSKFVMVINRIRGLGWELNTPLIIWPETENEAISCFPKTFDFHEGHKSCSVSVTMKFSEIDKFVHATNATNLLSILDLTGYALNRNDHRFRLKVNRDSGEKKPVSNVTTGGLLYCGIELPEAKREAITENRFARRNRYGSCVLKFPASGLLKNGNLDLKFIRLGTKNYWKEWSQMMLVDSKDREGDKWRILTRKPSFSVHKPDVETESFKWKLRYCEDTSCAAWTHPEFIFCEDQLLVKEWLKVEFLPHVSCPDRWNCIDCHISDDWNRGKLKMSAIRVNKDNESEGKFEWFFFCAKFKGQFNEWNRDTAIRMFAQSVPIDKREILKEMQSIFRKEDFSEIINWWKEEPNHYYKDWTLVKWYYILLFIQNYGEQ
jgi:hypothetical protein